MVWLVGWSVAPGLSTNPTPRRRIRQLWVGHHKCLKCSIQPTFFWNMMAWHFSVMHKGYKIGYKSHCCLFFFLVHPRKICKCAILSAMTPG